MKKHIVLSACRLVLAAAAGLGFSHSSGMTEDPLTGAWQSQHDGREETISCIDGYFVQAAYNKSSKQFFYTWGGPYSTKDNQLLVQVEFHTQQKDRVGQQVAIPFTQTNGQLQLTSGGVSTTWKQLDNGTGDLSGTWRIAGRKQGTQPVTIPAGPRKTLKLLTGTRFQWMAINTATKEFFGTGGGTYTFTNGKYTENIEFFSRDSSRVGASLVFDGKVKNGEWDHTGLSSRGEPIDEMWKRITKE